MVSITINNSYSRVLGLTAEQHKALASELSYTVGGQSAYFSRYGARRKSLLSKRGEFPTGLLHRVIDHLGLCAIYEPTPEIKRRSFKSTWVGFVPYEDQIKAVSAAITHERGTIAMPTGTGKSMVIAMIINELKVKTLIVVPSLEIKKQLTETLQTIFGDTPHITVENIDSTSLKTVKDYDCLIIDEAHHVAAKTYQKLNKTSWAGIYYRFFLTATPFRNDKEEQLLFEGIAGKVIYQLSYKDAIKKGYIVPVEAYYIELPKYGHDCYTWAQVYKVLVADNHDRNLRIAGILLSITKPALCLVKEIAHGKSISKLTGIPFVSGEDDDSKKYIQQFNSGKIKSLIGTEGVLGEGIDTKPCEFVIIAGLGKAKSSFMQKVGRSVRKYPGKESAKVIIFKDRSHKFTLRHFNEQRRILLDEYGISVVKLDYGS